MMQIFLTQLQAYNAMFKLLDDYYKRTKDEDTSNLLSGMLFLADEGTVDSAIWGEWIEAINDKKTLTKQEAFEDLVRFFENYHAIGPYSYTYRFLDEFYSAKDSDDISIPLVERWNHCVMEVLSEPEGTKEYLSFGDPMQNITQLQGFNTVYKLLDNYYKQNKSVDTVCLAENMLFLSDGETNVDPKVWDYLRDAIDDKLTMTRQEAFNSTIHFLESYGGLLSSYEAKSIASELRLAKGSEDFSIPLVELWDYCLVEALNEPAGARKYKKR